VSKYSLSVSFQLTKAKPRPRVFIITKLMTSLGLPNSFKDNNHQMHLDMQTSVAIVGKASSINLRHRKASDLRPIPNLTLSGMGDTKPLPRMIIITILMTSLGLPNSFKDNNHKMHLDMQASAAMVGNS
jgi:hypothetical protein